MAFSHLIGAFSLIVTQFQSISSYAAVLARLGSLSEGDGPRVRAASPIEIVEQRTAAWPASTSRCARRGDGRVLIADLDVEIRARHARARRGRRIRRRRWRCSARPPACGARRGPDPPPESDHILFVAERPYLPPGTLREALLRTGREVDAARRAHPRSAGLAGPRRACVERVGRARRRARLGRPARARRAAAAW